MMNEFGCRCCRRHSWPDLAGTLAALAAARRCSSGSSGGSGSSSGDGSGGGSAPPTDVLVAYEVRVHVAQREFFGHAEAAGFEVAEVLARVSELQA